MPNIVEQNYLEDAYDVNPLDSGQVFHGTWSQVSRQINNLHAAHEQIKREIDAFTHRFGTQIDRVASSAPHHINEQIQLRIDKIHRINEQAKRLINAFSHHSHEEIDRFISLSTKKKHEEIRRGNVLFLTTEEYLEEPYLETPYLVDGFNAHMRSQLRRLLTHTHAVHEQINRKIDNTKHHTRSQIQRRIDKIHRILEQINRLSSKLVHSQITQVLYNITKLRILLDFPSRGTDGTNWTASSTAAGDFSVNNLNTDIVEQVWRSVTGVKTGITLVCDTEVTQGIFTDTLAMLGHNLTTSASVLWEASNDSGFAMVGFSQVLTSTKTNIYYIAPMLPTDAYRYHRFTIDDPTNTAAFLQIGTIVFGSSVIFQGECFVDQVTRQTVHFADKIATEAFTNISNDRALKFAIGLEFKNLGYLRGNYAKMLNIFETARTSQKCLWIPTPQYVSRFAVFGKLETIPQETHNDLGVNADFVNFSIQVDESL